MMIDMNNKEGIMKNYPNIERSAYRPGEYVGYANGFWVIRKSNGSYGNWVAYRQDAKVTDRPIYTYTLAQMSQKLREFGGTNV
jgi:hypothetical protein